jgi:calcineurin-like phosphoesterase family protein
MPPDFPLHQAPRITTSDHTRVWVLADIQPTSAERARQTLAAAVDDVLQLPERPDAVWILGDALRGPDEGLLAAVAGLFISEIGRLELPVCYLLGNHDMDLSKSRDSNLHPLLDLARGKPGWHLPDPLDGFFFARRFGPCLAVFLGDHADPSWRWWTTHGGAMEKTEGAYPHSAADYARLSRSMAGFGGPVVVASHYAFPGGQKPSKLIAQLLPLPDNVKLVLHGHAHIGDLVWNKEDPWERDHAVEGQPELRQINISALESERSPGSHSAFLDLGPQGPFRMRIRCHEQRAWTQEFRFPLKPESS